MPKIKLAVKQPKIDMTPMVDLFMLLLTFFMLTTTFRPPEAAQIDTPSSVSEKQTPDANVITISIGKDNKVYFNLDNGKDTTTKYRIRVLEEMGKRYGMEFTKEQKDKFSKLASFGHPMQDMKKWLDAPSSKERDPLEIGIPLDSTDNQLSLWIRYARLANQNAEAAIRGDAEADYTVVKKIFDLLQENQVNKFNLTTNLEKVEIKLDNIKGGK